MTSHTPRTTPVLVTAFFILAVCHFLDGTCRASGSFAPGDDDTTFGTAGRVVTPVPGGGFARSVLLQPDGKIIAGGVSNFVSSGPARFCLIRYNPDGSIDGTFGAGGFVFSEIGNQGLGPMALQPDGKILAGVARQQNIFIARYLSNGNPDPDFGTAGVATIAMGANVTIGTIIVRGDGGLAIVGGLNEAPIFVFVSIRLNADGTRDMSYGTNGKATVSFAPSTAQANSAFQYQNGDMVLAGTAVDPSDSRDFALARVHSDGTIDTTFGTGGKTRIETPGAADIQSSIARQADGKLVVGGSSQVSPNPYSFSMCRLFENGAIDTSFGGGFVYVVVNSHESFLSSVLIQSNGKIVGAGNGSTPPTGARALVRFNSNGTLDTGFGTGGLVLRPSSHSITSAVLQPDGNIVVAGGAPSDSFGLGRYIGDAVVETSNSLFDFDGDGKTDIGIFRPAGGEWWINRSGNGQTFALQFGSLTDVITPADYTGDGKADIAFFRPSSGEWYVLRSEDFSFFALPFGASGDVPVPADYDADGKADFAVFRPSTSAWFISQSGGGGTRIFQFGIAGDKPVVADYDADGKADVGVFRQAAGGAEWWIDRSTAGSLAIQFGANTDKAVQGDYTGDGKADIAIWRPTTGEWFIVRSEDFSFYGFPFGASGDVVAPGDYDGDGKFDATVFRPASATWFISRTTAGTQIVQFGATGDRPLPNAFVP